MSEPTAEASPREYTLIYTTPQGSIEEAKVMADGLIDEGPYLTFLRDGQIVTALPHASVVQFGETGAADESFNPAGVSEDTAYLTFASESRDPWAELSGRARGNG